METLEAWAKIITNYGVAAAVVAYFIYKDFKLTQKMFKVLDDLSAHLKQVSTVEKTMKDMRDRLEMNSNKINYLDQSLDKIKSSE